MLCFQDVKLSAEVKPFVPQKKGVDGSLLPMSLCSEGGAEPTQIPSYLITCYPFVQENQNNRYTHTCTCTHTNAHTQSKRQVHITHTIQRQTDQSCCLILRSSFLFTLYWRKCTHWACVCLSVRAHVCVCACVVYQKH